MNEGLRGIKLDEGRETDPPEVRIGGQTEDHSNTPLVHDGIGYIIRGEKSHVETGYVVFLDALGMKGIWQHCQMDRVVGMWTNAVGAYMDSLQAHQSGLNAIYQFRVLSDTIIIIIPTTLNDFSIVQVFDLLLDPFITSIKNHMLFRGTISYGLYFISPRLILGPALDDAAIYNNRLNWIGIALTPDLASRILPMRIDIPNTVEYNTPLKKLQNYRSMVLDWPRYDKGGTCYGILQNKYGSSPDKEKYENTFKFYEARRM